jgi:hypothetical protein
MFFKRRRVPAAFARVPSASICSPWNPAAKAVEKSFEIGF